jgi:hypothetical protein
VQGPQAHEDDRRRAVRVGDDAAVVFEGVAVDLGDHEGHVVFHSVIGTVVDDDGAAFDGLGAEGQGRAFFALGAGEKRDIDAVESVGGGFLHRVRAAINVEGPGAPRQDAQFGHGKFALIENTHHLDAHGAGAHHGHSVLFHDQSSGKRKTAGSGSVYYTNYA